MLNIRTLLFEDVAKAKKILKDLNIPETDPRYTKLRKLLEKNIGYLGTFVNFMFNGKVEYDDLVALYERLQTEKALFAKLPKPFVQYVNFSQLQDDLDQVEQEFKFQKILKALPRNARELVTRDMDNETKTRLISISDEFLATYDKLAGSEELNNFYAGFARITNDPNGKGSQIVDSIQGLVNKYFSGKDFQQKIDQIKHTNGAEVIYTDPAKKLIVAAIYSFKASQQLGSPNWCIVNYDSSWIHYTNNRAQYFIWDYNYPNTDKYNLLGVTLETNGSFYAFQDSLNGEVSRTFGSEVNFLNKIGLPLSVLSDQLDKLEKEKEKRKFEEIKSKKAEEVTQNDIQFLQKRFTTAEQMIEFIAQTYAKMPRFALSYLLEMPAVDKKKLIPEILRTMKGKFVDEDDFYYMINTDNIKKIYPDIDAEKFRDTIIAYLKKARTPEEYDNALIYSYIIHNLDNFNEVMADVGEAGINQLTENEIQYIINLAISKGNKDVIETINRMGKLPKFDGNDFVDMIEVLDQKNIDKPVEKVMHIFGKNIFDNVTDKKVLDMINHLPDALFNTIFTIAGDQLIKKLSPELINRLKHGEKFSRVENLLNQTVKPEETPVDNSQPVTKIGDDHTIYAELLKAKGKRDIDAVVAKYGKNALRTVSPSNVAKILKNTDHPDKLVNVFGRELVAKALADPTGGSTLKMRLNRASIKPDEIAENNNGFDFLGIHADKANDEITSTKEFQVAFIFDLVNGLKNTSNWNAVKEEGMHYDKYADYSYMSSMNEYEFTYDYDGKMIPIKIWVESGNPIFMNGDGKRFRVEMLNTPKGAKIKEILLKNLDKVQ